MSNLSHLKNVHQTETETEFHDNGQMKSQIGYKNGECEGECLAWYENGQMESQVCYKNGVWEGECLAWYENGQMKQKGTYEHGELVGDDYRWYNNGQMKEKTSRLMNGAGSCRSTTTTWFDNGDLDTEYVSIDRRVIRSEPSRRRLLEDVQKYAKVVDGNIVLKTQKEIFEELVKDDEDYKKSSFYRATMERLDANPNAMPFTDGFSFGQANPDGFFFGARK